MSLYSPPRNTAQKQGLKGLLYTSLQENYYLWELNFAVWQLEFFCEI